MEEEYDNDYAENYFDNGENDDYDDLGAGGAGDDLGVGGWSSHCISLLLYSFWMQVETTIELPVIFASKNFPIIVHPSLQTKHSNGTRRWELR